MTDIRENQRDEDNEVNYLHMKSFFVTATISREQIKDVKTKKLDIYAL